MRFIISTLPVLLAVGAKPAYHARDVNTKNYNSVDDGFNYGGDYNATPKDQLWRRVRIPGSDGGSVLTASELFLVDDATLVGGCSSQLGIIDGWLNEARLLHNAVQTVYSGYANNVFFAALIYQYFGIKFQVDMATNKVFLDPVFRIKWSTFGRRIAGVAKFLGDGKLKNNRKPGESPRIFCSGDAGQNLGWDTVTKNEKGEDIAHMDHDTGQMEYLTLRKTFGDPSAQGGDIFWFSSFSGYGISKRKEDHPGRICGDPERSGRYALTGKLSHSIFLAGKDEEDLELGRPNRYILLCPRTFTPPAGSPHSLGSLQEAISSAKYPSGGNAKLSLDQLMPKSTTLYHELYHLTDDDDTPDQWYRLVEVLKQGAAKNKLTVDNPESFAFFAMACYVYLNPPPGAEAAYYYEGLPIRTADIPW